MRKVSAALLALLFLAVIQVQASAASDVKDRKKVPPYEIAYVNDYREFYNPGEKIAFFVEGKSPVEITAEPNTGFRVQASITNETLNQTIATAEGSYDETKRAWLVKFTAPSDANNSYKLHVYFFCFTEGAPCDDIYGRYSRAIKSLPLQVH